LPTFGLVFLSIGAPVITVQVHDVFADGDDLALADAKGGLPVAAPAQGKDGVGDAGADLGDVVGDETVGWTFCQCSGVWDETGKERGLGEFPLRPKDTR
jgi:hypothetical protein